MKRFCLKKGDRSSNGGGHRGHGLLVHHRTPVMVPGDEAYCSACESTGVMVGQKPRWFRFADG